MTLRMYADRKGLALQSVEVRLSHDRIHIGDVFRIGGALLEVTQPRLPCFKLEMKMDLKFTAYMTALSGNFYHCWNVLAGFHNRVIQPTSFVGG